VNKLKKNKTNKTDIIKKILGWIFGIFFGLIGFSLLITGQIIQSFLILIIVFILIPPLSKIIKNNLKINLSIWKKIVIIIVIFFLLLIIPTNYNNEENLSDYSNKNQISRFTFSSEFVKLPSTPKYTNSECRRLCYETSDVDKQGVYDNILKTRCREFCDDIESLAGKEVLKSRINEMYSSALLLNAQSNKDIRYCTKYEFLQSGCIIQMIKFENDVKMCGVLSNENLKFDCIQNFLNFHENHYDIKICDILLDKTQCISIVKTREAIQTNTPTICLELEESVPCHRTYFQKILAEEYNNLTSDRISFISERLEISEKNITIDLLKNLPISIRGVTTDIIPVVTANWSLCDDICVRNPDFMNHRDKNSYSGKECYRTVCLTEITLFNDNINYQECVNYSSKNGQKEAFVDCLMAQAKRDNNLDLCDLFIENNDAFVSICKDNVKNYNIR
jgi:hypothetical protein